MHSSHHRRPTLYVCVAALTLAACAEVPTAPTQANRSLGTTASVTNGVPTSRAVVVFRDTASIPAGGLAQITLLGGAVSTAYSSIGVATVNGLTAAAIAQLNANPLVLSAAFDRYVNWIPALRGVAAVEATAVAPTGDPWNASFYADGRQWGPRIMEAEAVWRAGMLGTPATRVGILDTGIDYTSRELVGLVDLSASRSFTNLFVSEGDVFVDIPVEPQLPGDQPFMDNHFHGTHVASTVASNARAVAGVAPKTTLVAVKVLNMLGSGTFEGVTAGILYAAGEANVDIINMSLGANVDANLEGATALFEMMRRAIRQAEKQGTIVISAAGNDAINLDVGSVVSTPCEQSTICVSATGPLLQQNFDQPATYTNYGITAIEVAAPGGNAVDGDDSAYQTEDLIIGACSSRNTQPGLAPCRANLNVDGAPNFYAWAAGTSMATPHVAGLAALVKSVEPLLSVQGLKNRILSTADDVGATGRDVYSNRGRVNARKAVGL
jgi:subtilisin family serine protease